MTLKKRAYKPRKRYFLQNERGEDIAWFDSFRTVALVTLYITGGKMTDEERDEALNAITAFDAFEKTPFDGMERKNNNGDG